MGGSPAWRMSWHTDQHFDLKLTDDEKKQLSEFLKSI
jgi:hypothetical protein